MVGFSLVDNGLENDMQEVLLCRQNRKMHIINRIARLTYWLPQKKDENMLYPIRCHTIRSITNDVQDDFA